MNIKTKLLYVLTCLHGLGTLIHRDASHIRHQECVIVLTSAVVSDWNLVIVSATDFERCAVWDMFFIITAYIV